MSNQKKRHLKLKDELNWVPSATDKELEDEVIQLNFDIESIKVDLFSYRYKSSGWRPRAQKSLLNKRGALDILQKEIDRRQKQHIKQKAKERPLVQDPSKGYWSQMNYYRDLCDIRETKIIQLNQHHMKQNEEQSEIIKALRREVGVCRFDEIAADIRGKKDEQSKEDPANSSASSGKACD